MQNQTIRVIATGGTIDSLLPYDSTRKSTFTGSHLPEMLEQSRATADIVFDLLMLKDSNDLTDEDRTVICERCLSVPETNIVITHGTDTLSLTAQVLGPKITTKTVVLVGAMMPFIQQKSDAMFNLGYAISSSQRLPPGVYVAMNGRVFSWDNVKKNREKMIFEALQG